MTFTSIEFAGFTLLVLGLYYRLPQRGQNWLLLIASALFIASWDVRFALAYAVLTAATYVAGRYVAQEGRRGRTALYGGIAVNLLALLYFKYSDFFLPSLLTALGKLGFQADARGLQIILPIGLSFFVVQAIGYLIDVREGTSPPVLSMVNFAVYMAYFPRVLAGPIERVAEFVPYFDTRRTVDVALMRESLVVLAQGAIRKVVIADLLFIIIPNNLFSRPQQFSSIELAFWLPVYSFAVYNDFAGYSAMARGISGLFGIPLVINFNTPFFSRTFREFWQRWHISLSDWLRDYVYMPVSRFLLRRNYKRDHIYSLVLPSLFTMAASALWHGLSWNMALWGGINGAYLVAERISGRHRPARPIKAYPRWRQGTAMVLVFCLTLLVLVAFAAELPAALYYWHGLFSPMGWIDSVRHWIDIRNRLRAIYFFDVALLGGLSLLLDVAQYRYGETAILRGPTVVQAAAINLALLALVVATMAQRVPPPFVYQAF